MRDLRAERRDRAGAADERRGDTLAARAAASDEAHERSAFARWGRKVSDRPWPWAIAATLVLVVLAIPLFSLRLGQLDAGTNPTSESIRRAYDLIDAGFGPGSNGPLTVVFALPESQHGPAEPDAAHQRPADPRQDAGRRGRGVAGGQRHGHDGGDDRRPGDVAAGRRDHLAGRPPALGVLPTIKATTYVVGSTASYVDFTAKVSQRMPWLILVVVALAFILLTVAFRSIIVAIKAAVLNLLSVGAAYGVVVAIFQWGWGSELVGIHEKLPIPAFVPMLMFAIVFGLSMDYEVFLISRVHEAWVKLTDAHRSVAIGIGSTARVITTAARS